MGANKTAPVIIKRKKKVIAGGHHGGAWKVAYADFVTAMMAFFMLMWLLNATTEKQRKGIADYFSPTIPLSRVSGGGDGSFAGDSVFSDETLAQNGVGAALEEPADSNAAKGSNGFEQADKDSEQAQNDQALIEEALSGMSGESMAADKALRHIVTRVTDDGLIIELFDLPGESLFMEQMATPTKLLLELSQMVSEILNVVTNDIAINGFTQALPIVLVDNPVWQLSSLRADKVRLLLQSANTDPVRLKSVSGFADRKPATGNPMSVRNNRIEIILLRDSE